MKILVNTAPSYPIFIGDNLIQLQDYTANLNGKLLFVVDKKVIKYHPNKIKTLLKNHNSYLFELPSGEKSKSFLLLKKILSFMQENKFDRSSTIIAIGGGVTGDLSAFAASIFMRGINIVHIPTTLLSMVDSSIGGKTGINFRTHKNVIGSFHQPRLIINDITFLNSLPADELISGMGEVIKYAFLIDHDFYNYLLTNLHLITEKEHSFLYEIISTSASFKASIIEADEMELGLRKVLNLGHTFAHAIESASSFKIKHGFAVAAGLISMLFLSYRLNLLTKNELEYYLQLVSLLKLPRKITKLNIESLYNLMLLDKKNRDSKIKFVLSAGPGKMIIDAEANKEDVIFALSEAFSHIYNYKPEKEG